MLKSTTVTEAVNVRKDTISRVVHISLPKERVRDTDLEQIFLGQMASVFGVDMPP